MTQAAERYIRARRALIDAYGLAEPLDKVTSSSLDVMTLLSLTADNMRAAIIAGKCIDPDILVRLADKITELAPQRPSIPAQHAVKLEWADGLVDVCPQCH